MSFYTVYKCKKCGQLVGEEESFSGGSALLNGIIQTGTYAIKFGNSRAEDNKWKHFNFIFPFLSNHESNGINIYTISDQDRYQKAIDHLTADDIYPTSDHTISNCPICGSDSFYEVLQGRGSKCEVNCIEYDLYDSEDPSDYEKMLKDLRKNIEKEDDITVKPQYAELIEECKNSVDELKAIPLQNSQIDVQVYLKGLLAIKTAEYSLEQRLLPLLRKRYTYNQKTINATCKIKKNGISYVEEEYNKVSRNIQRVIGSDFSISDNWYSSEGITKPVPPEQPPAFTQKPPLEPKYEKPGLFNKKAVLANNEKLKSEYESKLSQYRQEKNDYAEKLKKWQKDNQQYNEDLKLFLKKQEEHREKELNKYLCAKANEDSRIKKLMDEKKACEQALAAPEEYIKNALINSSPFILKEKNEEEINECISSLKAAYQADHDYLAADILFSKYNTLPAVSTIYEYFVTGRCSELTGPNGAYNLYENEMRQNIIIGKLDRIIQKLDEIKQNQYTLYQAIRGVTSQLSQLNKTASAMTSELESMNTTLTNIEDNTSVIAYNTAKTAYYSKVNADLTNALGYLIATK